jgi:hypothetical protein
MSADVREILVDVARKRGLITYGVLVNELGLPPMDGAWAAHPLSRIFEAEPPRVLRRPGIVSQVGMACSES